MARGEIGPGTTDPDLIRSFFHIWEDPHPHRHPYDEDPDDEAPDEKTIAMIGLSPLTSGFPPRPSEKKKAPSRNPETRPRKRDFRSR